MGKTFFDSSSVTWIQPTSLLTAPWSLHICVCVCVEWMSLYVTQCLTWLNGLTLCQMTELSLCSLTSTWAVLSWFSNIAVREHLSFLFLLLGYFPSFTFTWTGNHFVKKTRHFTWRLRRAARLQEAAFMKNCVADRGEVFPVIFPIGKRACTDLNWCRR